MQFCIGYNVQAWLALIADKLESTLEGYVPSGTGFRKDVVTNAARG